MENNLNLTELEYIILGFTSILPITGYDLKKIFEKSYIIKFSASPGSIYPALERLASKNYLSKEKLVENRIPKVVYFITEKGKKELVDWIKKPLKKREIVRYGLEIKILFLHNLTKEEKNNFLEKQIIEIENCIDDLPVWKKSFDINHFYRDKIYEEKLREFKNLINLLQSLRNL